MKCSEARLGRIFIVRLEDGDRVHEALERFARDNDITAAQLVILGGADDGSRLVVGPLAARAAPVTPMTTAMQGVHEVAGVGTIFPDENGRPSLHLHMAGGRGEKALCGCSRAGVTVWHVMEVVLTELLDSRACRRLDAATGFQLLEP